MLDVNKATQSTAAMILVGFDGSMSVVGTRVALVIAMLALCSRIGSAIGSAIVVVIWSTQVPKQLRHASIFLRPSTATEKDVISLFGQPTSIRKLYAFDDPMRVGDILAYRRTLYYCLAVVLGLGFVPLIAAFFQNNYFLGKSQNAVTDVGNDGRSLTGKDCNQGRPPPRNKKDAFLRFWDGK
ncbi:siderophore iron transporter [Penicillium alfredii]|uniref:Siderophore iron transporter n=1 Tax=Penicillium alfredii TaxID=1506179 RepID=A0A9W9FLI8_9EURO|nr:siderophore iron transporter [Penicillium alfredii]KAJ5102202.1 siderophore iron transporter [Penicillium alfredii]